MKLTLDPAWLRKDYAPETLSSSPFAELPAEPPWPEVVDLAGYMPRGETPKTLGAYAADLLDALTRVLEDIMTPVDLMLSGGYDSRILAFLAEELKLEPRYILDGAEPRAFETLAALGIPESRVYIHDLAQPDPYRLVDATIQGWAPLYFALDFMPEDRSGRTLVTGLGGGEWFSYPAAGWHSAPPRVPHDTLIGMWLDTWPQYWLVPKAWQRGYEELVAPYATARYARVANVCAREWLVEVEPKRALDMVRRAMLRELHHPELEAIGWDKHVYRWNLTATQNARINTRFLNSWLCGRFGLAALYPARMDDDIHACRMGGFASWCDLLIAEGHEIEVKT